MIQAKLNIKKLTIFDKDLSNKYDINLDLELKGKLALVSTQDFLVQQFQEVFIKPKHTNAEILVDDFNDFYLEAENFLYMRAVDFEEKNPCTLLSSYNFLKYQFIKNQVVKKRNNALQKKSEVDMNSIIFLQNGASSEEVDEYKNALLLQLNNFKNYNNQINDIEVEKRKNLKSAFQNHQQLKWLKKMLKKVTDNLLFEQSEKDKILSQFNYQYKSKIVEAQDKFKNEKIKFINDFKKLMSEIKKADNEFKIKDEKLKTNLLLIEKNLKQLYGTKMRIPNLVHQENIDKYYLRTQKPSVLFKGAFDKLIKKFKLNHLLKKSWLFLKDEEKLILFLLAQLVLVPSIVSIKQEVLISQKYQHIYDYLIKTISEKSLIIYRTNNIRKAIENKAKILLIEERGWSLIEDGYESYKLPKNVDEALVLKSLDKLNFLKATFNQQNICFNNRAFHTIENIRLKENEGYMIFSSLDALQTYSESYETGEILEIDSLGDKKIALLNWENFDQKVWVTLLAHEIHYIGQKIYFEIQSPVRNTYYKKSKWNLIYDQENN
ncbi:hypothetical protein [Mycoplasmopsis pulmonis]|uniref:hypothetical protein n=1 Tax=Mycoplasmopsis pulmonis TaxID=2107 RepID=UPI002ACE6B04|nr:hypothetical protein [Mycoplasmopsis pulmonis]MDZ7293095.1 hypothetical protein [Mycoplasmopsis pulmonis]